MLGFRDMAPEVEQIFDDGNSHLAMGELEEAAECYRRCVELESAIATTRGTRWGWRS